MGGCGDARAGRSAGWTVLAAVAAVPRHQRRGVGAMTATVLIADDHPPTRAGVRLSLESSGLFSVVAEVANAAAAVAAARKHHPDVVLLDIHMPGSGLEAARAIGEDSPSTA